MKVGSEGLHGKANIEGTGYTHMRAFNGPFPGLPR